MDSGHVKERPTGPFSNEPMKQMQLHSVAFLSSLVSQGLSEMLPQMPREMLFQKLLRKVGTEVP